MALLKKVRSSTLMETLVATVLIVVIFMMASMLMNNVFGNSMKAKTQHVQQELLFLQYQFENGRLKLPIDDTLGNWDIRVAPVETGDSQKVLFTAIHSNNKKRIELTSITYAD